MTKGTATELYQALWNSADVLRSKMDASEYKNYLLGLIFYKYLSDKMLVHSSEMLEEKTENLDEALDMYREAYADDEFSEELKSALANEMSYRIKPELTFSEIGRAHV